MIETIIVVGGAIAFVKGLMNAFGRGGGVARNADECDAHEAKFLRDCGRKGEVVSRNYLDWKRNSLGFQRRPGVNADLLAKFADRGGS